MPPKKSAATAVAPTEGAAAAPKPKAKAAKRAREEADVPAVDTTPMPTVNENLPLIDALEQLAFYEFSFGDKYAALSLTHLTNTLRSKYMRKLTASKDIPSTTAAEENAQRNPNEFVGRGHRQLIDEFLTDNKASLNRLEELKGENPDATVVIDEAFKTTVLATEVVGTLPDKEVLAKIEAEVPTYQAMTVEMLKTHLRNNLQPTTGAKADLVRRVCEGVVMGSMGRCPHCYGGKMKYNVNNGIYSCHGYMDDDEYRFCYYRSATCERQKWV